MHYISEHWVEIAGFILSFVYLYCSVTQRPSLWIFGFLCSALYIVVYFQSKFYADMTLQVYYLVVSVYGWINWKRNAVEKDGKEEMPVSRVPKRTAVCLAVISLIIFGAYYAVLIRTDSPLPAGDSFTTALSIAATWMLAKKYIEYWLVFIVVDAVSAGQYFYKALYPTAVLFIVYTVMAVVGYMQWRKTMRTTPNPLKGAL